jgi:hypothetical protein
VLLNEGDCYKSLAGAGENHADVHEPLLCFYLEAHKAVLGSEELQVHASGKTKSSSVS